METDDPGVVLSEIRNLQPKHTRWVVSIDGKDGSGKSTLGKALAGELGFDLIDLDDDRYRRHRGPYVANTDTQRLAEDVKAPGRSGRGAIIASVCILDILERAGMKPDIMVYVKAVTQRGDWGFTDKHVCDASIPLEEALRVIGRGETKPGIRDLAREIARYHRSHDPVKRANIVYVRRTRDT